MTKQEADTTYTSEQLKVFAHGVFEKLGMTSADAALMAGHLAWADLHGVPWLGVRKIPQYYRRIREGGTEAKGEAVTLKDTPSLVVVDAKNMFAQVVCERVMDTVIAKAKTNGVCIGLVRNTTSAGALGFFPSMAVANKMIGMAINNGPPLQAASGSIAKVTGNQAFAIASPAGKHPPLVLDMATSAVTLARLHEYEARGEKIPDGFALDASGAPTNDPTAALLGVLLPMGGHRGYGLALMWEMLTGVLAGSDQFLSTSLMPDVHDKKQGISVFLMAINPEAVMPYAEFTARVDKVIDAVHASKRAPGVERILAPGERSHGLSERRAKEGIPIPAVLVATLKGIGAELGVAWPDAKR